MPSMLKKLAIIFVFMVLVSLNVSALSVDSITMCKSITVDPEETEVNCQNEIEEVSTLDGYANFDTIISGMKGGDVIRVSVITPNGVTSDEQFYLINDLTAEKHLIYATSVSDKAGGAWKLLISVSYNNGPFEEASSKEFKIIEQTTAPCLDLDSNYFCCQSPLVCPGMSRVKEGVCGVGLCCKSAANCQEPIQMPLERELILCKEAGLQHCEKVVGALYNYNVHGPLAKEVEIRLRVRDIEINCFDKTDIAIGYYDEINNEWVERPSYITEISKGIYKVSALIDYIGYIAVIKTSECVEISCTFGGYQFEPTSGFADVGTNLKFKICGLVPGCDATRDNKCDQNCPQGIDPDCKQTSCSNTNDGCCLISKDNVCDPNCDINADPDCCDKTKDSCCPGDLQRSGSQNCDKNCGLADVACAALKNGCTSNADDCCYPAADATCDLDCVNKPDGGNPDPDCGGKTSKTGDSCNPIADGKCDFDCVFGVDADCVGGYVPFCGNGVCDSGEKCATPGCEEGQVPTGCPWWQSGTECGADCGTCCYCASPSDGGGW